MDTPEDDDPVLAALQTLESADDTRILKFPQHALIVGSRLLSIAKPLIPPADNRPRQAAEFLEIILQEQPELYKFLKNDPSSAIRTIRPYDNLQLTHFTGDDQVLISHIMDIREWIWDYRSQYLPGILFKPMEEIPLKLPPQQGKLKRFMHSRGLPDSVYNRLKIGQRCWQVEVKAYQEIESDTPIGMNNKFAGIWVVVMLPIFLKLAHAKDKVLDELVDMLCSRSDILSMSCAWSEFMIEGQCLRRNTRQAIGLKDR